MLHDSWFPLRFEILPGVFAGKVLHSGADYEIREVHGAAKRALVVRPPSLDLWINAGLVSSGDFERIRNASEPLHVLTSTVHALAPLSECQRPSDRHEALAFAGAFRQARLAMPQAPVGTAIFTERLNRVLPLPRTDDGGLQDEEVLGRYLCGVPVSCHSTRRITALSPWISDEDLVAIVAAAGLAPPVQAQRPLTDAQREFSLPGRSSLERLFREHVVDIVQNETRYRALGIEFPSAIALHGPPGCGKTFAVEALVSYLDWPSYNIDSTSIGSPYIHETGRKIGAVFQEAASHAPSVVIIDEMDAFLAERGPGGDHRTEEVAEFLRRLPEAQKNRVLVIGMTNRPDSIDRAILRRGRFDHVMNVEPPTAEEVHAVIEHELQKRPREPRLVIEPYATALAGRPLSDAAFLVREAARLAARSSKNAVDKASLDGALQAMLSGQVSPDRRIGFR
jgi:cell division protease FtsH